MDQHSLRVYVRAFELKTAAMDWRSAVLAMCHTGTALVVARLKSDPGFTTEEDRVRAFVAAGHGCRATYFNHAKRIMSSSDVLHVALVRTAPPAITPETADLLELLRRRHGRLGKG